MPAKWEGDFVTSEMLMTNYKNLVFYVVQDTRYEIAKISNLRKGSLPGEMDADKQIIYPQAGEIITCFVGLRDSRFYRHLNFWKAYHEMLQKC